MAKAKRYPVSITDTDIFEHVLAILGAIYRNAKDEDLKKYIEEELDRALKGEWDIEGVLNPRRCSSHIPPQQQRYISGR